MEGVRAHIGRRKDLLVSVMGREQDISPAHAGRLSSRVRTSGRRGRFRRKPSPDVD